MVVRSPWVTSTLQSFAVSRRFERVIGAEGGMWMFSAWATSRWSCPLPP